ncbi:MFS transporter [Actinocorallia longicatena]|uniref:MFS transporter n=1 Tax=Actinocorallia longicatena TaxID=111803 RepID=A0ABP6Q7V0_9ACTN
MDSLHSPAEQTPAGAPTARRTGLILAVACLCQALVVLDTSVVNIALPKIGAALDFSAGSLSWVVNAYLLTFGGLLLLGGRIADLTGYRRALLGGLALFGTASALGGLAQTSGQLVAARAAQGAAAAVLAPIGLTIIMITFPQGPARARAIGVWAMVSAAGSALGVLAGGLLTEALNWRWVMFVNVPIVVVALLLGAWTITGGPAEGPRRLDVVGAVLATAGMTTLVYAMVQTEHHPWGSARTLSLLGAAVLAGAAFLYWEARVAAEPLVRLGVFANRTVSAAGLIALFVGAATVSGFYFASLFVQRVWGYEPLKAGAAFLPFCAGVIAGSMFSGRLTARLGLRPVLTGGLLLGAGGMVWFGALEVGSGFVTGFAGPSLLASAGLGACVVASTTLGTTAVRPGEAGLVSGLLNAGRQCGGSIGLAVVSTVAVSSTAAAATGDPRQALATGYDHAFLLTALLLAAAAVTTVLLVPGGRPES